MTGMTSGLVKGGQAATVKVCPPPFVSLEVPA
ncbi:hypothetical protein QFZ49_006454 [Streptomyces turgidiscabies]|uniref:Uncharacterized protein n=1 Tax=Streptomyces turgidiscabies TaxID=85558 RepID=A0ABU0RWX6_9ACTN|nr:hypothetical protein [Streptomyces turgidiscabies]